MVRMLSTHEVRDALAKVGLTYSIEHVIYMVRKGYFPGAIKGPGKTSPWRIPEESVKQFIETKITRIEPDKTD